MAKRSRGNKRVDAGQGWELIRPGGAGTRGKGPLPRTTSAKPETQRIRVREERRPQGRTATVARGFQLTDKDLKALGKKLKAHVGAGGKAVDGAIELQGMHAAKVTAFLGGLGYRVD